MRRIREVLRLRYECGLPHRLISASVGISKGSVSDYLSRAEAAGLTWGEAAGLDEEQIERKLFTLVGRNEPGERAPIDFEWVHREMRRTSVTLQLLWVEYRDAALAAGRGERGCAYQYSQFCDLYADFRAKVDVSMRQVHRAGEKAFLDYSGKKPVIIDPSTGELIDVELFVMVLGASNYTYAEATRTQRTADFVGSTVRALEYFEGVPQILVPDQLRSAVTGPDRYDPEINATYAEMARHYGLAVVPARPRKPKDKAKVEGGVLIAQRWILACLRNRQFFSLDELNDAIAELLERLNARPFQRLDGCRRSAFESIDRPAMRALPASRYQVADWKNAKVNIDYHVMYDDRPYSVPHTMVGAQVQVRATVSVIEILHKGRRVIAHRRCWGPKGTPTTLEEHRPKSHRDYGAWPPSRVVSWAETIGPSAGALVTHILETYPHPEDGYRKCMALLRTSKKYGAARVDAACRRAIAIGSPNRKSVEMILKKGLENAPVATPSEEHQLSLHHENVRGSEYFDQKEKANDG
jgi:transposase